MASLTDVTTQDTFREIFDQAPTGMAYTSMDGEWLEVNQRLCEMTGYSRDELLATNWQKITHPEDLPRNLDVLAKVACHDLENYSFEKRYIRKDGRTIWVRMSVAVMHDAEQQNPPYFIAVIDEITEYKRAQELHRNAEEKYSIAFRQTPTAIVLFNLKDRRLLEVNEAFVSSTGYSRQEAPRPNCERAQYLCRTRRPAGNHRRSPGRRPRQGMGKALSDQGRQNPERLVFRRSDRD